MKYADVALFTDLDGTLFNSQHAVSEKNRDAIARFTRQGGSFGISTGRGPINAKQMLPDVELNAWSVVLNGGEAYNYQLGAVASPIHLDKAAAETLMAWVIEQLPEVNIMLCTEEKLLFPSNPDYADLHFVETHQPMDMVTLEEAKAYNWMKILFCAPRPMLEQIKAHGEETCAEGAMESVYTNPVYLEYMPPKVNKGNCLRRLRQLPQLQGKCFVAVGDYSNDLELLREADVAVAVGNALPEVKAVADHVICTNDEDAIAYLIDELIPSL